MHSRKFIALPADEAFRPTPKLWMAVGLMAYNFHLLSLKPVQILATSRDARHIPIGRAASVARGRAVMLSTEGLTPNTRTALTEIGRTLLTPFGLSVSHHGGAPLPGSGHTTRYLLIEDHSGNDQLEEFPTPTVPTKAIA